LAGSTTWRRTELQARAATGVGDTGSPTTAVRIGSATCGSAAGEVAETCTLARGRHILEAETVEELPGDHARPVAADERRARTVGTDRFGRICAELECRRDDRRRVRELRAGRDDRAASGSDGRKRVDDLILWHCGTPQSVGYTGSPSLGYAAIHVSTDICTL